MYPILMLVAGLVLWLAGGSWFTGAVTAGIVLTVIGAVWFLVYILILLAAIYAAMSK